VTSETNARRRAAQDRHTTRRILRDLFVASIRHGEFSAESLTEFALVARFGASRGAVRAALLTLAEDGLLVRRQRFGTHVTGNTVRLKWDEPRPGADPLRFASEVLVEQMVPNTSLLRRLLRSADDHLAMRDARLTLDGVPMGFRTTYSRIARAREELPVTVVHTELGTTKADPQTTRLLRVDAGTPMLTRMQVLADSAGDRVAVTFDQYRGDRVSLLGD